MLTVVICYLKRHDEEAQGLAKIVESEIAMQVARLV